MPLLRSSSARSPYPLAKSLLISLPPQVDPRHQRQGIGKTLLDRMLACLDPMYAWKDPAPFLDMGNPHKWMSGGHRITRTLVLSLLYPEEEEEQAFAWKKKWLMRSNFHVGGVVPNIARKARKQYVRFLQIQVLDDFTLLPPTKHGKEGYFG